MNKSALASAIAFRHGLSQAEAVRVVDSLTELIGNVLEERGQLHLNGFGRFVVRTKRAQVARNPRTGEPVHVPERCTIAFTPARALRERVNRKG